MRPTHSFMLFVNRPIQPNTPYAELWMGTHKSGQSLVEVDGKLVPLQDFLKRFPFINPASDELSFLMKILSIGTALSIQSHPDLRRAKLLHGSVSRYAG